MVNKEYRLIPATCPICGQYYEKSRWKPAPTCGNPNCIREARARGLPFAVPPRGPEKMPEAKKKRGKDQRGKK